MRNPSKNTVKSLLKKNKQAISKLYYTVYVLDEIYWDKYVGLSNIISSVTKGKTLFIFGRI